MTRGPEPVFVDAARPAFRLKACGKEFTLKPSNRSQRLAAMLFLRLLLSTRADEVNSLYAHRGGARFVVSETQIAHESGAMTAALRDELARRPVRGSPGVERQETYREYTDTVTRALRRILHERLGLDGVFPAGESEYRLAHELIQPSVDLVKIATRADEALRRALENDAAQSMPAVTLAELDVRNVFVDGYGDRVHSHLEHFEEDLREMHCELLRATIDLAYDSVADDDRELAGEAGRRLARHGPGAFDARTAQRFIQTACDGMGDLDDRMQVISQDFGARGVPSVAQKAYRRLQRPIPDRAVGHETLLTGRILRVAQASWKVLGVHGADPQYCDNDGLSVYIPRPVVSEVRARIQRGLERSGPTVIVLHGGSTFGKTRAAWEAARRSCADAWLIAPSSAQHAQDVCDPAVHASLQRNNDPVVIWLDDLERFVAGDRVGLTAGQIESLDRAGRPVIVLCTRGGRGRNHHEQADRRVEIERFVALGEPEISVPAELDEPGLDEVRRRYGDAVRSEVRREGLGSVLTGRRLLRRRYQVGDHPGGQTHGDPDEGRALIDAGLAWTTAIGSRYASDEYLYAAWALMRPRRGCHGQPDEAAWSAAKRWAVVPVAPGQALLSWAEAEAGWEVSDAVRDDPEPAQHVRHADAHLGELVRRWIGRDRDRAVRAADAARAVGEEEIACELARIAEAPDG